MTATKDAFCTRCRIESVHSRTLCTGCYQIVRRADELSMYPTTQFLAEPENHVRWAMELDPDTVGDIVIEYGYRLVKLAV